MSEKINPMTGLPIGQRSATIDTTTGTEQKVNPMTGKPIGSVARGNMGVTIGGPAGFTSSAMSTSDYNIRRKDDISRYQKYDVPLGQDLDWDEIRARNQSTAEKWGYGLTKALTTTVGAVAENTLGVIAGLGSLATGGAYWDNVVGRNIDNMNEYMREHMPNYMTEAEQNMGTLQRMGTANFWADTVANGLGYSVGSLATMFLTGGVGAVGMAGKAATLVGKAAQLRSLYGASKAVATGAKLANIIGKGAKGAKVMRAGQMLDAALMMSLAESSVEARETYKGLQEDLTQQYLQSDEARSLGIEYEWQIPDNIQDDIEKSAVAAGNTNFGFNMAVTSGTNMFAFGKAALGFRAATKASKDVAFDVAQRKAINKLADSSLIKRGLIRAEPIARNGISEAVQEGAQFASNIYSTELYASKYHDGGVGDRLDAFNKSMSETFGSQEGRESMLVGLLTGMIMGGFGAIKNNEYKARNESAQALTNIINSGYFDTALAKAEAEQGASSAMARMQDALEKGDIKRFKDNQQDLIIFQGMQALDHGGFEVMLEKLEDSKSLSDSDFAQMYGYSTEGLAEGTSFSEISGGESKAQVVDNLIGKMRSLENTYQNVNERFAVKEKTKGLPRLLMSEEQRAAEDKAYREQLALRDHLIYKGAHIVDRTNRQRSIEDNMQELIDNDPVLSGLGINVKQKLKDASQPTEDFEFTEDDPDGSKRINKRQQDTRQALVDVFNQMQEQIQQEKPDVLDQFGVMANNYLQLNSDTNEAINAYNKLASDPQYRKAYQNNIDATQAAMAQRRMEQKVTEIIDQSETSQAIADAVEGLDTTDEQKARLRKKFKDLRAKERAAGDSILESYQGSNMTPQQVLDDLKAKKTEDLTPAERAGLSMAIAAQQKIVDALKEDQTPEQKASEMQDAGVAPSEPDPALDLENLDGVEAVSEDGRILKINGKIYYNQELDPTDAIERSRAGRIRKVRLVDEQGNRHTFWKAEQVDAIAYHIMLAELAKADGQPTLEREQALIEKRAAEEALEKVATKGKHGVKTTESLHQEIYDLERLLEAAQRSYDTLKQIYIVEAGATKEDLKNDPELAPMAKNLRSLRSQIAARKRVLKARGESAVPTSEAILRAENLAQEEIDRLQLQVDEERQNYSNTKLRIEQIDQELADMQNAPRQEQLSREFDERRRALTEEKRVAQEILKEIESNGKRLQALIKLQENKLKRLKDELSEPQSPREEAESTDAENAQRQNTEAENRDRREDSKAEGSTVAEKKADIERRRKQSLIPNPAYEEGYTGNRFWMYTGPDGQQIEQVSTTEDIVNDINAMYDAELDVLEEESKRAMPTNDQVETEKEVKTGPRKAESQPGFPEGKVVETINFDQDPAEQESQQQEPTDEFGAARDAAQKEGATADLNAAQDEKVARQVAVIKNILDESESVEDAVQKLLEGGHIVSFDGQGLVQIAPGDTAADPSRDAIYFKINGVVIPMYRSSKGTSDKKAGEWYPFFFKSENWVAKGLANNYKEGYGNPELKAIADALNDNVQYSTPKATYELDPIAGIRAVLPSLSEAEAQALYLGTYGELNSAMVDILQNWNSNIGKLDLSSAVENLKAAKVSNPYGIGGEIQSLEEEYAIFDKAIARLEQMAKPESPTIIEQTADRVQKRQETLKKLGLKKMSLPKNYQKLINELSDDDVVTNTLIAFTKEIAKLPSGQAKFLSIKESQIDFMSNEDIERVKALQKYVREILDPAEKKSTYAFMGGNPNPKADKAYVDAYNFYVEEIQSIFNKYMKDRLGYEIIEVEFAPKEESSKLSPNRPAAVPPPEDNVGPNLSVKMAKDSAEAGIQQITDRQGNERYVLVVTPNGIAETNYDDFNGTPLISDTNLAVHAPIGTEVEFEIIENSFFVEKYGEDASPLDHVADVPVYVKVNGQRIGKLEASNSTDRANIVRKLAAGERVTSTISNKLVGAASVNHTRVTEGVDSPVPYFNDPAQIFNNEVLQGEPLKIAVVSDALGAKSWLSGDPGLDSDIASSRGPKSFNNLASGQVGFVVQSPDSGDSGTKVIVGNTAALTPAAQNAVLDNLKNNNFDNAKEIVAHSKADDSIANPSYLSFGEFKDGQQYLVYKSPATGELVRVNAENIAKAANNGNPTFSFVKFNPDTGKFAVIPNNKKLYETMAKDGMLADFKNFLKTKKFQVSVDRANLDAPYTSRVTNTEYSSYQDYLFSPTETGTIDGRFGHSSIVATDVSLVNGSIFNNPTVEFSLGDIQDDAAEVASELGADKIRTDIPNSKVDEYLREDPLSEGSINQLGKGCSF